MRRTNRTLNIAPSLGAGSVVLLAGCGSLLGIGIDIPEEAVVEVEAEATEPLLLVTSKDFQPVYDPEEGRFVAAILFADTVTLQPADLPFTDRYDVEPEARFLARVVNPAADTAEVTLRVIFDGDVAYDRTLRIADAQYMEYSHIF